MLIYTYEGGDLGWTFNRPYRDGGSSRYFTIASLCVDSSKRHLPKRSIKKIYRKFNWSVAKEKKWADMSESSRKFFAEEAVRLSREYGNSIKYHAIVVKKENVARHIRTDPNKLYNYMIGLSLLQEMSQHQDVKFFPDERSIKVASGNSLHDYLQTKLWFDKGAPTTLSTEFSDSSGSRLVQFSDMLAGATQGCFEDGKCDHWTTLQGVVNLRRLFFS